MRTGFKATNWRWNRNADIRDKVDRLTLELYSDNDADRELLSRVRQAISNGIRDDKRITDIQIALVPR